MWPINDSPAHKIYTELDFCKWHAFFNLIVFVVVSLVEWVALQITPLLKLELLFSFILDGFQGTTYQNDRGSELCVASLFPRLLFLVFTFRPWMSYAWETWERHFKAYSKAVAGMVGGSKAESSFRCNLSSWKCVAIRNQSQWLCHGNPGMDFWPVKIW